MIWILCGIPGAGKTSFLTYLAVRYMTSLAPERLEKLQNEVSMLNMQGFNLTCPNDHLVYTNYSVEAKVQWYVDTLSYDLDGFDFGLYDIEHDTKFIPPYSSLFFMEGQTYLDSRQSRKFRASVSRAYELHRHYDLDIFIDAQRESLIDLNVRSLAAKVIELQEMTTKQDRMDNIVECKWRMRIFEDNKAYESYLSSNTLNGNFVETTVKFDGNIFDMYDSKSNRAMYFYGRENEDFWLKKSKPLGSQITKEYINDYAKYHSLANVRNYWS